MLRRDRVRKGRLKKPRYRNQEPGQQLILRAMWSVTKQGFRHITKMRRLPFSGPMSDRERGRLRTKLARVLMSAPWLGQTVIL